MVIFKKRDKNIFLITNQKVMFSTLKNQNNLVKVSSFKNLMVYAMISWIWPKSKFYLVVRNPFDRIASFYRSKFIKAEENRIWMIQNEKGNWQKCTEHFFPYLHINTNLNPELVSKTLKSTKFEKMISILPKVLNKDKHTRPQYHARKISFRMFGFNFSSPIRFEKIFKIENKEDLKKIEEIFDINLSKKHNSTENIDSDIFLSNNSLKTIVNIYRKDFKIFEYEEIPYDYTK